MSQLAFPGPVGAGGLPLVYDQDDEGHRLMAVITRLCETGEHEDLRELLGSMDIDQLRDLVLDWVTGSSTSGPKASSVNHLCGPSSVCDLAVSHAATGFGTTPEAILGADRHRTVTDARAVAMTAIRRNGLTLTSIAEHFAKDHTSVIHAVRRTEENPRLLSAATRIAEHVAERYAGPP